MKTLTYSLHVVGHLWFYLFFKKNYSLTIPIIVQPKINFLTFKLLILYALWVTAYTHTHTHTHRNLESLNPFSLTSPLQPCGVLVVWTLCSPHFTNVPLWAFRIWNPNLKVVSLRSHYIQSHFYLAKTLSFLLLMWRKSQLPRWATVYV